jgi:hypothetical protein
MNTVEIGTAVVLDAKDMKKGDVVEISGVLCAVSSIEGESVILRALSRWEQFMYRVKKVFGG